ncbi:MAG: hypothetical protein WC868_05645 [Bacteroidales bacterium]
MTLSILLIIAIGFLLRAYIFKKVKYRNLHSFMIAFFINCLFYYLLPAIYFASDLYIYSTQNDWSGGMTIMLTIDYLTSILLYIFVGLYLTIGVCWILKLGVIDKKWCVLFYSNADTINPPKVF